MTMPKAIPKSRSSINSNGGGSQAAPGRKRKLPSDERPSSSSSPSSSSPPQAVGRRAIQRRPPAPDRRVLHRTPTPPSADVSSTTSPPPGPSPTRVAGTSNFLLEALRRIRELQDELDFLQNDPYAEDTDDDDDEQEEDEPEEAARGTIGGQRAEAVGWAVCARETMHFLQREGIPPDSPLMVNLRRRLVGAHGDALPDEGLSC